MLLLLLAFQHVIADQVTLSWARPQQALGYPYASVIARAPHPIYGIPPAGSAFLGAASPPAGVYRPAPPAIPAGSNGYFRPTAAASQGGYSYRPTTQAVTGTSVESFYFASAPAPFNYHVTPTVTTSVVKPSTGYYNSFYRPTAAAPPASPVAQTPTLIGPGSGFYHNGHYYWPFLLSYTGPAVLGPTLGSGGYVGSQAGAVVPGTGCNSPWWLTSGTFSGIAPGSTVPTGVAPGPVAGSTSDAVSMTASAAAAGTGVYPATSNNATPPDKDDKGPSEVSPDTESTSAPDKASSSEDPTAVQPGDTVSETSSSTDGIGNSESSSSTETSSVSDTSSISESSPPLVESSLDTSSAVSVDGASSPEASSSPAAETVEASTEATASSDSENSVEAAGSASTEVQGDSPSTDSTVETF